MTQSGREKSLKLKCLSKATKCANKVTACKTRCSELNEERKEMTKEKMKEHCEKSKKTCVTKAKHGFKHFMKWVNPPVRRQEIEDNDVCSDSIQIEGSEELDNLGESSEEEEAEQPRAKLASNSQFGICDSIGSHVSCFSE